MFCLYCGNPLPDNARFCIKCGAKMEPAAAPGPADAKRVPQAQTPQRTVPRQAPQTPYSASGRPGYPPPPPPPGGAAPKGYKYTRKGIMEFDSILSRTISTYFKGIGAVVPVSIALNVAVSLIAALIRYFLPGAGAHFARVHLFTFSFAAGKFVHIAFLVLVVSLIQGVICRKAAGEAVGEPQSITDAINGVIPLLVPLVLASILVSLAIMFGFIFLVIPGIWLSVSLSLTPTIVVLERKGPVEAMSRSYNIVSGNWWLLFGIMVVLGICMGIAGSVMVTLPGILIGVSALILKRGLLTWILFSILAAVVYGFILPLMALMLTIFYMDKRAKTENGYVDIDLS